MQGASLKQQHMVSGMITSSLINNETSPTKRQFFRLKITRKCMTLCIKNVYAPIVSDTIHNLSMFYITQPNDIIRKVEMGTSSWQRKFVFNFLLLKKKVFYITVPQTMKLMRFTNLWLQSQRRSVHYLQVMWSFFFRGGRILGDFFWNQTYLITQTLFA